MEMAEVPGPKENLERQGEVLSLASAETASSGGSSLESSPWDTKHKGLHVPT